MRINVKRLVVAYVVMVGVGLVGLVLSSMIPSELIEKNVRESLVVLQEEGLYPNGGFSFRPVVLDTYTDGLMLNLAYGADSSRPLWSAMTNPRMLVEGELNQIAHLEAAVNGVGEVEGYERYWHGYLVWLRPLLVVLNYVQIRWVLMALMLGGAGVLLGMVYRRFGIESALTILLGLLMVDFLFLWQSMQFVSVFLVGLTMAIFYLVVDSKKADPYLVLFVAGGLTAFFDLLTAPMVVLGIVVLAVKLVDSEVSVWKLAVIWGIGYLLVWATKWVLVGVGFVPSALETAVDQIMNRTITQADSEFSYLKAVSLNVRQLIGYHKVSRGLVLMAGFVGLIGLWRYGSFGRDRLQQVWSWLLIALMPLMWYLVAANHSYLHVWYTYRALWMSVVGVVMVWVNLMDWGRVRKDGLRLKQYIRR